MAGFEVGLRLADVRRGTEPDAADGASAQIAEEVTEEVLHNQDVVVSRVQDELLGCGIGVNEFMLDVGVLLCDLG